MMPDASRARANRSTTSCWRPCSRSCAAAKGCRRTQRSSGSARKSRRELGHNRTRFPSSAPCVKRDAVADLLFCLDTSVLIKWLVVEEPREQAAAAAALLLRSLSEGRLVAPAWAWVEVGSVLRKKLRKGLLTPGQSDGLWSSFCELPIDFLDSPAMRTRAWELAERYGLPTLYDAAFLACIETATAPADSSREYWTADDEVLRRMESARPSYVRRLGEYS